ncbi:hypothetical protein BGX27_000328, partial [Mortierella sp. AM989]
MRASPKSIKSHYLDGGDMETEVNNRQSSSQHNYSQAAQNSPPSELTARSATLTSSQFDFDVTTFVRLLSQSTSKSEEDMHHSPGFDVSEGPNSGHDNQKCNVRVTKSSGSRKRSISAEPRQTRRSTEFMPPVTSPLKKQAVDSCGGHPQQVRPCTILTSVEGQFSYLRLNSPDPESSILPSSSNKVHNTLRKSSGARPADPPTKIATPVTTAYFEPSLYFPLSASALHQKRRKARKHAVRVPRPKNCFMLYRSKALPMIMAELGSINNKIISKIAAERWRAESEPVKAWYRLMAKQGKEEHARNNPGYRYAPHKRLTAASNEGRTLRKSPRHRRGDDSDSEDGSEDDTFEGYGGDVGSMDDEEEGEEREEEEEEENHLEDHGQATRRSPRKYHSLTSSKPGKKVKLHDNSLHPSLQSATKSNDDMPCRRRQARVIETTRTRKDDRGGSISQKKSNPNKFQPFEGSQYCPINNLANDNYMSKLPIPTVLPGFGTLSTPLSLLSQSLMEQQYYLTLQQNESLRLLQQHQQQQQQQLATLFRTPISIPPGQVLSSSGLYNLSADGNNSASTLVDPTNHWMTHYYHGDTNLVGAMNSHASIVNSMEQSFSKQTLPPPSYGEGTGKTANGCFMDKLYAQYNSDVSWEQSTTTTSLPPSSFQEFPLQLFETKEPDPMSAMWSMSLTS